MRILPVKTRNTRFVLLQNVTIAIAPATAPCRDKLHHAGVRTNLKRTQPPPQKGIEANVAPCWVSVNRIHRTIWSSGRRKLRLHLNNAEESGNEYAGRPYFGEFSGDSAA